MEIPKSCTLRKINDNFRWSERSKNNFDSYIQWCKFIEDLAIFKAWVKQKG